MKCWHQNFRIKFGKACPNGLLLAPTLIHRRGGTSEKKYAFTLAETLITLVIIGVVAALTVPNMIIKFQKDQTTVNLKHTYSILYQAVKMSELSNGKIDDWIIPSENRVSDMYFSYEEFSKKYILPYIKYSKICTPEDNECYSQNARLLNGQEWTYNSYDWIFRVILLNGAILSIFPRSNVVELYVDLNGRAKPNIVGKDIFCLHIRKSIYLGESSLFGKGKKQSGLYFYGEGKTREELMTTGYPCNRTGLLAGVFCGALIKSDDWQIKDDYPW